ncbi:MAG TPA: hypothetical protein VLJ15_05370 [Gammaproteobacteria bacterium]|nr:hypothetical protein [Gammaproteobacteria bacterium]
MRTVPKKDTTLDRLLENPLSVPQKERDLWVNTAAGHGRRNALQYALHNPDHYDKIILLLEKISLRALRSECVFSILSTEHEFFQIHFSNNQNDILLMQLMDTDNNEKGLLDYCIDRNLNQTIMALLSVTPPERIDLLIRSKIARRLPFNETRDLIQRFLKDPSCQTPPNLNNLLDQIQPRDIEKFLFFINDTLLQPGVKTTPWRTCHLDLLNYLKTAALPGQAAKFIASWHPDQIKELLETVKHSTPNVITHLNLRYLFQQITTIEDKQNILKWFFMNPSLIANTDFLDVLLDQHATLFKKLTLTPEEQEKYDLLIFPFLSVDIPNLFNLIVNQEKYYPLLEPLLKLASKDKFIPEILPKVFDKLASLQSILREEDMCKHLISINQLLRGHPEEKTNDTECHPDVLPHLKKLLSSNGAMAFISLLPIIQIQLLLDQEPFEQQLDIIKRLKSSQKKCALLRIFLDSKESLKFFNNLLIESQKSLIGNMIATLTSDNPAKKTCFQALRKYIEHIQLPYDLHQVVTAMTFLTEECDNTSKITALSESVQSVHGKFSKDPLASILQNYLKAITPAPAATSSRSRVMRAFTTP